ncbi:GTP 3',8-cyclase MoaA [Desulfopila inferna]|uniref:GTP 3',8-cyclase MoaA n=1 Tax=Desulfopila inferna TaxID=468528 RepID=UPI0019662BB6|nr:GTP 3',8-cyclase MoaA [Desulfopila inferna]MBM9604836.1 GTP 3',8-cyclase MoaA [Desulfopila inferna]
MSKNHLNESRRAIDTAVPANQLIDNYHRSITYLRLSVTDRCDLRCRYCCPEKGIQLVPHDEILTFEELLRLVRIFASLGVSKYRITGGEPFARKGLLTFLKDLKQIEGVGSLYITTNGVQAGRHLDGLVSAGIDGINLSLDTLEKKRFWKITRRDRLEDVLHTLHGALQKKIPIKINSVVQDDTTDEELRALIDLGKNDPVTVRFIETMPFSGSGEIQNHDSDRLFDRLKNIFPAMEEDVNIEPSTARLFVLPRHSGKIGLIEGHSRHFCKTCNKVRITPTGMLKTCLYDNGALDLRAQLRNGCNDKELREQIIHCAQNSWVDGHAAERVSNRSSEPSMAGIGG